MVRFCTYCSSSGNHVPFYSSTVNINLHLVLFTEEGRQMSGFEPSLPCFCAFFRFFFVFFGVGAWVNACLSNVLFTAAAVGLQMSGFEPSLPSICAFFSLCFPFIFWGVGARGWLLLLVLLFYFSFHTQNIPVFGFPSHQTYGVPFVLAASLSPKIPRKIQVSCSQP